MKFNILIGGKAGQGPNALADILSKGLIDKGYYAFNSREYESVIRGGHNYNLVSFSDAPISSNPVKIDILVCLDENTDGLHKHKLNKKPIVLKQQKNRTNIFYAGALFKILGLEFSVLEKELRRMKNFDKNIREARQGYSSENSIVNLQKIVREKLFIFESGSFAVAEGAVKSGLEYYYSYPMTPATPVMAEIAQLTKNKEAEHFAIELESEISVINAAIGSSIVGAKAMCGSSGGGFDLMTESLSLCGQAEVPLVLYLAQRPGPSTGLATYTSQGDLNMARYSGHGEFSRIILTPGDAKEALQSTNQAFYLSQKFRLPVIILSDKHLAESKYTFTANNQMILSEKSIIEPERFNSYEHDAKTGIVTEDPKTIISNFQRRLKKQADINKEIETNRQIPSFKIHGNKESKNIILGWGSTKGALLDAIADNNFNCKFIQILCIEPFSEKIKKELSSAAKIFVVENNATSPLSQLIAEKTGIFIDDKNKILKYDGRPFYSDELAEELKKRGVR